MRYEFNLNDIKGVIVFDNSIHNFNVEDITLKSSGDADKDLEVAIKNLNALTELRAVSEEEYDNSVIFSKSVSAKIELDMRKQAKRDGGIVQVDGHHIKLTEDSIKAIIYSNKEWQLAKNEEFKKKKMFAIISDTYWKAKGRVEKLELTNNLK